MERLPIDGVLAELSALLGGHGCVVLRAATGAGKTTRVPPALLRQGVAADKRVLLLQPRRVAARAAAARMAAENGWTVGGEVGYQVRFEDRVGDRTRIAVVTEGILLRRLHDDPFLQDVGVVIFDEFHERNLNSDLALGMVRQIQQSVRPDLKVVVMSATLAAEAVVEYLDGCPRIEAAGRTYPVAISYLAPSGGEAREAIVVRGVRQVLDGGGGDVLVFLPGLREIRQAKRALEASAERAGCVLLELYGDLPLERQAAILEPGGQRKIVLSTNVAETSLTIPGVTAVVDCGWARSLRYDPRVGLDRLELTPISQVAAEQRAGRAGRTQPGVCLRLWDERRERARPALEEPEVRRCDLAGAVLQLLCWIEPDVNRFPWFERPRPEAIERAQTLLRQLGAADERGVTKLGRRLARLPVHPRLGRLLVEAERRNCPARGALAAALLSERSPFGRGPEAEVRRCGRDYSSRSDVLDQVAALEESEATGRADSAWGSISRAAARSVYRVRDQLSRQMGRRGKRTAEGDPDEALLRSLLAAFPDRLAKRRESGSRRGVMVGGRGVRLADESRVLDGELFLCIDVDGAGAEARVRKAAIVERSWLPPDRLRITTEVAFDAIGERITARRRRYWEDLLLEETAAAIPDTEEAARLLAAAARERWDRVFPGDDASVGGFVARVRWLSGQLPDLGLPELDEAAVQELLPALCQGRRSFAELRKASWLAALRGLLRFEQLQLVDREAPERLTVPSGRSVPLQYQPDQPPILAARIQELFGWSETPRLARGRVPVLLHLLAPNMRPQQVTDDLRSFWNNGYSVVRKELRRRYPKHAWPEDPWSAKAPRK
ncbi:MAG: ATP-dependent helicase HrpB [Candidatus Anammoximicrobium sp.]|nr:ATP-dependent helicase HrpB [Candidatus Anammoximicrobium sp.]